MRYASEIETINESLYCINDAINEAFNGSDVEEKWDQLLNTELKNIIEKFAECSGNGVAADSFHCVLTYAYELNEAIENFFESLGDVRIKILFVFERNFND